MAFAEEANPIVFLLLNLMGYIHCRRDSNNIYAVHGNTSPTALLTLVIIGLSSCLGIIFLIYSEFAYQISMIGHVLNCTYLFYAFYEMWKRRHNVADYLSVVGKNFLREGNTHRAMNAAENAVQYILFIIIYLLVSLPYCYDEESNNNVCVFFLVSFIVINFYLPRLLNALQRLLLTPLILRCNHLRKDVKYFAGNTSKTFCSDSVTDFIPPFSRPRRSKYFHRVSSSAAGCVSDMQQLSTRFQQLETLTTTYNKVMAY